MDLSCQTLSTTIVNSPSPSYGSGGRGAVNSSTSYSVTSLYGNFNGVSSGAVVTTSIFFALWNGIATSTVLQSCPAYHPVMLIPYSDLCAGVSAWSTSIICVQHPRMFFCRYVSMSSTHSSDVNVPSSSKS